ncbi:MAG: radical SAM protein [Desulfobacterales bacterium]|nr:radical SAM protein [Desulfobacterales bacterium]
MDINNLSTKQLLKLPNPLFCGGIEAYNNERELCLSLDKKKNNNYHKYLSSLKNKSSYINYLPIKLDIENVSRCNFRCKMCQVSEWKNGKRADDMIIEAFQHLIDEQYGAVEIKLQGMGEPLLGGETYFKMVEYARSKHIWVRTVTNASLLHKDKYYKRIIDADVNEIQISIDGADKKTFEGIRCRGLFEKVVENCILINSYCEKKGIERTKMWVVLQQDNQHQLFEFIQLAKHMKFKSMVFSLDLGNWGQEYWAKKNEIQKAAPITLDIGHKLIGLGLEAGIKVFFWFGSSKYSYQNLCPWPFERVYISSDLRVVPCCIIANPDVYNLGSAMSITETWNNKEYTKFRQTHLDGNIPKICHSCYIE